MSMYWHVFVSFVAGLFLGFLVSIRGRGPLLRFFEYDPCRTKPKSQTRPHSLRNELDSKELLFIGVMTAAKYLDTRASAVHNTWGREVPGRLEFFMSEGKTPESKLPITTLAGVQDNEYPPQKKAMSMLRHMHDHYIDKFQWFMRADDDVYVRTEKLRVFLMSLNSSTDLVLGQGGVGKQHEINKLGLMKGECYCLGGPGVIMSQNVLRRIAPNIEECLKDTASTHEDVELGRCIRKFAGVSCLWAQETKDLFQQVYNDQANAYHGWLDVAKLSKALTLHPVKEPAYMFRLHAHFLSVKLSRLHHNSFENHAILKTIKKILTRKQAANESSLRARNADFYHQSNANSTLEWEFLSTERIFDLETQHSRSFHVRMEKGLNRALGKTMHDLDKYYSEKLGPNKINPIQMTDIDYGYLRVNPKYGIQFSFAIYTKTSDVRLKFPWRPTEPTYDRTDVQQAFSELQANVMKNSQNTHETVHFIVPLEGKLGEFRRFLKSLRRSFLLSREKIAVLVVNFPEKSSPKKHIEIFEKYKSDFSETKFLWENIDGEFNRAKALQKGVEYFANNSLLFFSDVDLTFKREFIYRCRSNTIEGKQVYFPMMFSQFNRSVAYFGKRKPRGDFIYTNTAGVWRKYSFGPVCIYASDVKMAGGFNTEIKGWGFEDVDLANKVLVSELGLFRSPDPGIVHLFHAHAPCNGSGTEEQRVMCQRSTKSTYAPKSGLVNYMMAKEYIN